MTNATLTTEQAQQIEETVCNWRQPTYDHSDANYWDADCGKSWAITEGTPTENGMKFCHGCGKPIKEHPFVDSEDEELAGTHNWTPPNYTDEQWQKLDQEYQDHVAEQALQKLSDFHQSIEHDGHWSDCSTHNEPAYPNGECDCGGYPAEQEPIGTYKDIANTMNSLWNGTSVQKQIAAELNNKLLYAAPQPVQQIDLTDSEIAELWVEGSTLIEFACAVIAADREKNK